MSRWGAASRESVDTGAVATNFDSVRAVPADIFRHRLAATVELTSTIAFVDHAGLAGRTVSLANRREKINLKMRYGSGLQQARAMDQTAARLRPRSSLREPHVSIAMVSLTGPLNSSMK